MVKLNNINFDRKEIKIDNMKKIIGIEKLPLAETYVSLEISDIPTAYINAIRRTGLNKLNGYCLTIPHDNNWNDTNDEFIIPQFISQRLNLIPLKPNIENFYKLIKFNLIIENNTFENRHIYTKDLKLVSGNLSEPIFNPTFKICTLRSGKKLVIKNIYISTGTGKDNSIYQVIRRPAYSHLDIEQYSHDDIYKKNGSMSDCSGYKLSSMVANPKHHLFTCVIPATNSNFNEIIFIFIDICLNIKNRINKIILFIQSINNNNKIIDKNIEYSTIKLSENNYESVLKVYDEGFTIKELIKRTLFDKIKDIINIKDNVNIYENLLTINIIYKIEIDNILIEVLKDIINIYDSLQNQFIDYIKK